MFNLLIVDDFAIDRQNVRVILTDFNEIINIVGECGNGKEALEFVHENNVDIIISDIEMPFMNGLELAKNINMHFPNIKIIFCSLYDEFEYARKALVLNAYGYILKPLDKEELFKCLMSAISEIEESAGLKKEFDKLKNILENSKPQLLENFIKEILYSEATDEENMWEKAEYLESKLEKGFFKLVYIEIDEYESLTEEKTVEQKQFFTIKVNERFRDISVKFGGVPIIMLDDSHFVYIVNSSICCSVNEKCTDFSVEVVEKFKLSDISVTVSMSDICENISDIRNLLQQCMYLMRYKFILGNGKVIKTGDVPSGVDSC
ncbi:response regulator [Clostridium lacusfryxellense]|uniref:response regulator n=1 Tax=Clostridium lacusfryxellense TaxID=205328 RepID=UPI001C0E058D|nr:response regulator [Clostridium lacusfryxellense]MBU3113306.1 response regulator [Clostridium lacusfryxellense]